MSRNALTMTVAVTILLVSPLAGAKWMSFGTYEPDTSFDTSKYMTQNAPGTARNSTVYFNAYQKNNQIGVNLNSGLLETSIGIPSTVEGIGGIAGVSGANFHSWQVIMGVWTDCNGDGFVGLAETAALEYHARVLTTPLSTVGTSVCPPVNVPSVSRGAYAAAGMPNNYNNWVTEFLPIGGVDYDGNDERVFFDMDAKVWAEPGVPDAPLGGGGNVASGCTVGDRTRGNGNEEWGDGHSTGAFLWALDCKGQRSIVIDPPGPVGPTALPPLSIVGTFNTAAGASGLGFGTDPRNSTSPLNREVGSENADNGGVIVRAQDCGSGHYGPGDNAPHEEPELVNTGDLGVDAANDADDMTLLRPVPANPVNTNPATWSVPATINYTLESAPETPGQEPGGGPNDDRDCNFDNDEGRDFYGGNYGGLDLVGAIPAVENNPQVAIVGKTAPTWNLRFSTSARGTLPGTAIAGGGGGADPNLGIPLVAWTQPASNGNPSEWVSGINTLNPAIARVDLQDPANSGLPRAPYLTFYGYVGSTITGRPWTMPNAGEKYGDGANSCNGQMTGSRNGWNCDASQWYIDSEGKPITAQPSWCTERPCQGFGQADISVPLARVHDLFTFRDVDCIDGRLGATGLGAHPAFFNEPCSRP